MRKELLYKKSGFPGTPREAVKAVFKTSRVFKTLLFLWVCSWVAPLGVWAHPHPNPAGEDQGDGTGLQVLGGALKIGGYLKTRLTAETDTRKIDGEAPPTTVFSNRSRIVTAGEESGPAVTALSPEPRHAGHGGSAPSSSGGSAAEDDFADGTSLRAELSAVFSRKEGGIKLSLRKNVGPLFNLIDAAAGKAELDKDLNYFDFVNAYGWFNLWDNMITVSAGIIDDGIFGTSALEDTATDAGYDTVRGLRLAVTPWKIPGLLFGTAWDFGTYLGGDQYFGIDQNANAMAEADQNRVFDTFTSLFSQTRIGALYIHERWGGVSVSVKPNGLYYNGLLYPGEALWHGINLLFGIKVTALLDFRFIFEGELRNMGIDSRLSKEAASIMAGLSSTVLDSKAQQKYAETFMPGSDFYFSAVCEYFYDLSFGARYHLTMFDKVGYLEADEVTAYTLHEIRIFGSYKIFDWFTAGFQVQFDIDGLASHSYDTSHKIAGRDSVFKGFYLKPGLTFTIAEGLSFSLTDKIYFYNESYVANAYGGGGYILNQIQLNFIWSF
ncbi:MAG: hypothetical protein LBD55_00215 [Treponema sp.]|jgi:hypothetical protein|nr:hypothetical protein [Treponema sp.]